LQGELRDRAQFFALASLVLISVMLIAGVLAVQPLSFEDVDSSNALVAINLSNCLSKLFVKVLAMASRSGCRAIFHRKLIAFQGVIERSLLAVRQGVSFEWSGEVYFNWNDTVSSTYAVLVARFSSVDFNLSKCMRYEFKVEVVNASWFNRTLIVVFRGLLNGEPVNFTLMEMSALVNTSWIKLSGLEIARFGSSALTALCRDLAFKPLMVFAVLSDVNGVVVKVKFPVKSL